MFKFGFNVNRQISMWNNFFDADLDWKKMEIRIRIKIY